MKAVVALMLAATVAHADPAATAPPPPPSIERVPPDPNARAEAIVASVITGGIIGLGAYSILRMKESSDHADHVLWSNGEAAEWTAANNATDHWFHMTLVFGGLMVVSGAVTGYMWSRTEPRFRASVTPQGGFVGYSTSF
ncbi:MAG: hypothetical protein JO257_24800 [Deltaproteobacteria bacterium]|nr:hypothetical protein [Deltaproteobacteria bacterium]